ncbi:MAG: hypothetical protein ABI193_12165 [Minicystis sp.]
MLLLLGDAAAGLLMNAFFSALRSLPFRVSTIVPLAALVAAITSGCGVALSSSSGPIGSSEGTGGESGSATSGTGSWGTGGSGGGDSATAGTSGAGGGDSNATPYFNGSYSYLCGGSKPDCVPGTEDCTPGGPGGTGNSSSGGMMISCQLLAEGNTAVASCGPAGEFAQGNPCETTAHCGAGLGCVITPSGGVCRPYCCDKLEDCPDDTYCAPLPMAEAAVKIPVCVPVKKCMPLDDSTCDPGQTCTIVRDDGTTSCVDLGVGLRAEGCPCASGFVCSQINNTCLKLCHLGNDADCMDGTCQGGVMGYPDGIGVCVGYP